jgi:hypothetical protein
MTLPTPDDIREIIEDHALFLQTGDKRFSGAGDAKRGPWAPERGSDMDDIDMAAGIADRAAAALEAFDKLGLPGGLRDGLEAGLARTVVDYDALVRDQARTFRSLVGALIRDALRAVDPERYRELETFIRAVCVFVSWKIMEADKAKET